MAYRIEVVDKNRWFLHVYRDDELVFGSDSIVECFKFIRKDSGCSNVTLVDVAHRFETDNDFELKYD